MLQLVVHPASDIAVGTSPANSFFLRSSTLLHARGTGRRIGAGSGMLGRVNGGSRFIRLASALTNEVTRHAMIAVEVNAVLFNLFNFDLRILLNNAFLKSMFGF